MNQSEIDKCLKLIVEEFSTKMRAIYHVGGKHNSAISDIDILLIYDNISPNELNELYSQFRHTLIANFQRTILLRWGTASLFESLQFIEADSTSPIILDVHPLHIYQDNIVSQFGFEGGILSQMLTTGILVYGDPILMKRNTKFSPKIGTLRHYYQHNISQMLTIKLDIENPFIISFNSIKILSMALNKYAAIINIHENVDVEFRKESIAIEVVKRLPQIERNIIFVSKYFNGINPTIKRREARYIYNNSFIIIETLLREIINSYSGGELNE